MDGIYYMTANVNTATGQTSTPQSPNGTASGGGNGIVTPGPMPTQLADVPFPMLVLAAVIVGAGIYYVSQWDKASGWALAFLILLTVAFGYPAFGSEITKLFNPTGNAPSPGNRIVPTPPGAGG